VGEYMRLAICPVCNKRFIPAVEHIYKADGKYVCSWGCQRKVEKEKETNKKER
jgi:hypothetical protein